MIEFIIGSVSCVMGALAVGLCIYLVHIIQEEKRGRVYRRRPQRKTSTPRRTKVKAKPRFKVSSHLQSRLILLVGDCSTAERLVSSARKRHPGQTEDWYWEKSIYDLERDRGR